MLFIFFVNAAYVRGAQRSGLKSNDERRKDERRKDERRKDKQRKTDGTSESANHATSTGNDCLLMGGKTSISGR
jgi:hypothetical protein